MLTSAAGAERDHGLSVTAPPVFTPVEPPAARATTTPLAPVGLAPQTAATTTAHRTSTQVWFGPAERPLHGHLSLPPGGRARGGVVLCPPMGEESRASHRTFRRLSERLADAGLAALRFDYDGTGDSAGAQDDPDRVDAWLASVETARHYLRDLGLDHVSAVGMRLGATIAGCQAAAAGPFAGLVLWDPCVSGRTFLREGEALYGFGVGALDGIDVTDAVPVDGYRHTPGYQYDAATAKAMRRVDLGKLPTDVPLADRVLLLLRDDRPEPDPVVARVRADTATVSVEPAVDQGLLLDVLPHVSAVPERALTRVVSWLVAGAADLPEQVVTAPAGDLPALVPSGGPGSPPVRERVVRLGPVGLFGVATEPVDDRGPARPWMVLINVATEHHVGPGRRWVDFAREWAAMGYRSVRIDQAGIGESPTRPGRSEDKVYDEPWLDDVAGVVDDLGSDGSRVALMGLCSGGHSAFEAAMRSRVAAIFAVNPVFTLYGFARGEPLYTPRRRAASVPVRPISRLSHRHRRAAGALWRAYRQVALWHAPMLIPARAVRRGTRVQMLCSGFGARDLVEVAATRPLLWWLRRRGSVVLEVDPTLGHAMLARRVQEQVRCQSTAFVRELHGDPPSDAA